MKDLGDKEGLAIGALLAAGDVDRAKKVLAALAVKPSQLTDPLSRAVLTIAVDMVQRNELPSAATVFTAGGSTLFDAKDQERLRDWQINNTLTDAEIVTIGRTLYREAQKRRVGDLLVALGTAIKSGQSRQGRPFGFDEGQGHLENIWREYKTAHSAGITGAEAVALTRARAEQRWAKGQTGHVPSGMSAFDKLFGGYPRQLCYVLGHFGKGKSTFITTQLALWASLQMNPSVFFTEDDYEAPVQRHVALRMGMKQRDAYSKPFDDDAKARAIEEQLKAEWAGLQMHTRAQGNTVADVLRLFTQDVVEHGAQVCVLDNITGLQHVLQNRSDTVHAAAARALNEMQAWSERWNVCLLVAAHTNNAYWERTKGKLFPEMTDTADTGGAANAGRYVRFGLGIWQVGETLRATCIKNNAEGALEARKATLAWDAHIDQGLVDVDSAREVNLQQEWREQREAKEAASQTKKDAEARRVAERNAKWKAEREAKRRAEEAAKQPAQGTLLEVENPKERT